MAYQSHSTPLVLRWLRSYTRVPCDPTNPDMISAELSLEVNYLLSLVSKPVRLLLHSKKLLIQQIPRSENLALVIHCGTRAEASTTQAATYMELLNQVADSKFTRFSHVRYQWIDTEKGIQYTESPLYWLDP